MRSHGQFRAGGRLDPNSADTSQPVAVDVDGLSGLACVSAFQCTAVDGAGREVTFDPSSAGRSTPVMIDSGSVLAGIACPLVSQCTVVDAGAKETTFDPTSQATVAAAMIDRGLGFDDVACPRASQCTALNAIGIEVTFNPRLVPGLRPEPGHRRQRVQQPIRDHRTRMSLRIALCGAAEPWNCASCSIPRRPQTSRPQSCRATTTSASAALPAHPPRGASPSIPAGTRRPDPASPR